LDLRPEVQEKGSHKEREMNRHSRKKKNAPRRAQPVLDCDKADLTSKCPHYPFSFSPCC
jgi:hypothetical protein